MKFAKYFIIKIFTHIIDVGFEKYLTSIAIVLEWQIYWNSFCIILSWFYSILYSPHLNLCDGDCTISVVRTINKLTTTNNWFWGAMTGSKKYGIINFLSLIGKNTKPLHESSHL